MSGLWVQVKKVALHARMPEYAHENDLGADMFAAEKVFIPAGKIGKVPLGVAMSFSPDWYATLNDRSSVAEQGLFVVGGQIDADYRGEWVCMLYNATEYYQLIEAGDKIVQAVWHRRNQALFIEALELRETERGEGGFGSTDEKRRHHDAVP
jgi:dUTP pyrophosphatase